MIEQLVKSQWRSARNSHFWLIWYFLRTADLAWWIVGCARLRRLYSSREIDRGANTDEGIQQPPPSRRSISADVGVTARTVNFAVRQK